jgi:hypothetical protein
MPVIDHRNIGTHSVFLLKKKRFLVVFCADAFFEIRVIQKFIKISLIKIFEYFRDLENS